MELKDRKLINNGGILEQEQRLEDKVVSTAIPLGSTLGQSTLADRKAISNLPKFGNGKGNPFANAALNVMGSLQQNRSNIFKTIGGALGDAAKAVGGAIGGAIKGINTFSENSNKTFGTNGNAMLSAATGAVGLTTGIIDAHQFNMTADDALQDAGTSEGNIGGVAYERQNAVNASQISEQMAAENKANTIGLMGNGATTGAAIGSVIPGVGTLLGGAVGAIGGLVGGLFGAGSRKRKMERMLREARDKAYRKNDYARSGALTSSMQQQYAQQYGDTESQSLYGFVNGKQSFSAAGPTNGYNARVSNGEIIANKFTGEMFRVPGIPNNKDGKLAYIRPTDTIITNKYGLSDYVAETGDLEGGEAMMSSIMKTKGTKGYKCGKLPKFALGLPEWANAIGNGLSLVNAAIDKNKIENDPISRPNTRRTNPYADAALRTMADLRYNNYQAYNDLWDTNYKYTHQINNNNNLSAAQRAIMSSAGYRDAMDSMAKLNQYAQETNNKWAQAEAQFRANLGESMADRDMKSSMFDYEGYNQAHGAKRFMASQRAADMNQYMQNFMKGIIDMHMWRKNMDYFEKDLEERRKDRESKQGNPKKETARTKSIYPYRLPEVSKSIVYKNKPVVGTDINPIIGNWNRFMNDSPQYVSPFIMSLFK